MVALKIMFEKNLDEALQKFHDFIMLIINKTCDHEMLLLPLGIKSTRDV